MSAQNSVEQKLIAAVRQSMQTAPNAQRCWLAVSGGLDSMVLMHIAAPLLGPQVVHINHQLSPHANSWADQVKASATALGLSCITQQVNVEPKGQGLEQAARQARYAVFEACLETDDCLLLAHHQNDQAETLLLRLLRGAGLAGLGAMATLRPLGRGHLLRPFLHISRAELLAYAQAKHIAWVEDESNASRLFDRNYLRHSIFPSLTQRWPKTSEKLANTAGLLREDYRLLETFLLADLALLEPRAERWGQSIALPTLLTKTPHHRHSLLRTWLNQQQFAVPSQAHLQQIDQLCSARVDSTGCVSFGNCEIRRFAQRLYAMPPVPTFNPDWQGVWSKDTPPQLPTGSFLPPRPQDLGLPLGNYTLRFRRGGERCRPIGRNHSQSLKKLLQEAHVVPWLRDRIPLVYTGEHLVAVGDLWLNH